MENGSPGLDCHLSNDNNFVCTFWRRVFADRTTPITNTGNYSYYRAADCIFSLASASALVNYLAK